MTILCSRPEAEQQDATNNACAELYMSVIKEKGIGRHYHDKGDIHYQKDGLGEHEAKIMPRMT